MPGSAWGHERTYGPHPLLVRLTLKADTRADIECVSEVPERDIGNPLHL